MLDTVSEIKPGMIVKTKGSIIPMSVNAVEGMQVACYWFDGNILNKGDFSFWDLSASEPQPVENSIAMGNTVRLRSGSPLMYVEKIEFKKNKPHAICSWQAGNAHYLKKFNALALVRVDH